jgi:hypothetical protein
MSQQLKALATLAKDPGLIPSTHLATHDHPFTTSVPSDLVPSSGLQGFCTHMVYIHRHIQDKKKQKKKKNKKTHRIQINLEERKERDLLV